MPPPSVVNSFHTERVIPSLPYKVLDAYGIEDDFYMNLLSWSSDNNLAVGVGNSIHLWNGFTKKVTKFCDLENEDRVCSVEWAQRGSHLAIGTYDGFVQGHKLRVGALAWSSSLLSSGSRDKSILHHDIRANEVGLANSLDTLEVCGLKWSCDNRQLASRGIDDKLFVWNRHATQPVLVNNKHRGAVKAIAWSPHYHGLIASGGGSDDQCIRFWNTNTDAHLSCIDTASQVCNLEWSKNVKEIVSTHKYSDNNIIVRKYPTMSKLATLTYHTDRVLHMAISPDGQTIVTCSGGETLCFWDVFPSLRYQASANQFASSLQRTIIR